MKQNGFPSTGLCFQFHLIGPVLKGSAVSSRSAGHGGADGGGNGGNGEYCGAGNRGNGGAGNGGSGSDGGGDISGGNNGRTVYNVKVYILVDVGSIVVLI